MKSVRRYWKTGAVLCIGAGMILSVYSVVLAEYYQYKDKNGVVTFTDNLADVPPAAQVKRIQSISQVSPQTHKPAGHSYTANPTSQATWEGQVRSREATLEQTNRELSKTYQSLKKESQALDAMIASAKTQDEQNAHLRQRKTLNLRIKTYHQKLKKYMSAIDALKLQLRENSNPVAP